MYNQQKSARINLTIFRRFHGPACKLHDYDSCPAIGINCDENRTDLKDFGDC